MAPGFGVKVNAPFEASVTTTVPSVGALATANVSASPSGSDAGSNALTATPSDVVTTPVRAKGG
jgi:hypothetical protein